jgi:hypothetical protein
MFGGSCTSARASAVFMRSPWLKPSVRRSSSARMSSVSARPRRALRGVACQSVQGGVVDDVLARAQARVQPARIAQDPEPAQRRARRAQRVDAVDRDAAGVGRDQPRDHPQRGGLARTIRTQQAGDAAVGRDEADPLDRHHGRAAPPQPAAGAVAKRLCRPSMRITAARSPPTQAAPARRPAGRGSRIRQPASTARASASLSASTKRCNHVAGAAHAQHAMARVRHHHVACQSAGADLTERAHHPLAVARRP